MTAFNIEEVYLDACMRYLNVKASTLTDAVSAVSGGSRRFPIHIFCSRTLHEDLVLSASLSRVRILKKCYNIRTNNVSLRTIVLRLGFSDMGIALFVVTTSYFLLSLFQRLKRQVSRKLNIILT